jgi:hypothetical protein
MEFRSILTDAWQFQFLLSKDRKYKNVDEILNYDFDDSSPAFLKLFFDARKELMKDAEWPKLMSPYPFFHLIKSLLAQHPKLFRIISTRNYASIKKTLNFHKIKQIEIFSQEDIRKHGSKLDVIKSKVFTEKNYIIFIDDMRSHLEPFEEFINLCIHAGWGYEKSLIDSYTHVQAFQIINSIIEVYQLPSD